MKSADGIALKEKGKMFLSNKTMFYVCSMIMGFEAYCDILFKMYPGSSVSACYTNQDKLGNFFGKQRAHNGATTNPTIIQTGTNHICIFTWLLSVSLYQEISDNLYKDISFAHHTSIWPTFLSYMSHFRTRNTWSSAYARIQAIQRELYRTQTTLT